MASSSHQTVIREGASIPTDRRKTNEGKKKRVCKVAVFLLANREKIARSTPQKSFLLWSLPAVNESSGDSEILQVLRNVLV